MNARLRLRLSLMMALAYSVQGAFWPLLAVHLYDLGIDGRQRGLIFGTMAVGSFVMPLGFGQLVDRFLAAEKLLALIFLIASGFLAALAVGVTADPARLIGLFLAFWLITAPAFSLTNTVALRHLARPDEQFAGVRLWGTVGWMAVGWFVSAVMAARGSTRAGQGAYEAFWVAAGLALVFSAYCLTLPHTPPLSSASAPGGPGRALALVRRPGMAVFLVTAFGVTLTTPFVFQVMPTYFESLGMPRAWVSTALTLGQWPEIATLAVLPWIIRRFGVKGALALGIAAWALRYASLAARPPLWLAVAGIPLHGVGVGCFTVAGQLHMDRQAPRDLRGSTQALYTVLTSGLGSLSGSLLAGASVAHFSGDFASAFLVPCVLDVTLLVYFCAGFRANATASDRAGASSAVRPSRNDGGRAACGRVGNLVTESADG